jgi:hypothetical protein
MRAKQAWPPAVVPEQHWAPIHRAVLEGLEELGLAPAIENAAERVQDFAARIERSA